MQIPLKDKNDIKIFILYLMRHIGYPLDFSSLNDIVMQDGMVSYIDFVECFAELLDMGNIQEIRTQNGEYYMITPQGTHVADNLESNLLGVIKEKSLKSAVRLLSFEKRGASSDFSYEELPNDKFLVNCVINDKGDETMNLKFMIDSRQLLERIKNNFKEKPEVVYKGMLAILSGDVNFLMG